MKYLNMVKTISKVELNVLCDNGLSNLSSLQVVKKVHSGQVLLVLLSHQEDWQAGFLLC